MKLAANGSRRIPEVRLDIQMALSKVAHGRGYICRMDEIYISRTCIGR